MPTLSADPPTFEPSAYARAAWTVVRRDPTLVLWRVAADVVRWAVLLAAAFVVVGALAIRFMGGLRLSDSLGSAVGEALELMTTPAYAVGALGMTMLVVMATLVAQAVAYSRIWQAMALAARGHSSKERGPFAAGIRAHFAQALGLRALLWLVDAWLVLAGLALILPMSRLAPKLGAALGSEVVVPALSWALALTFIGALAFVWRVSAEFAAAALFIDRVPLGVAMLRGASTALGHLGEIYRILVGLAGYLLVPLGLYWVLLMLYNVSVWLEVPGAEHLGLPLQLGGELVMLVCFATLAVMIQAAAFLFYGAHNDATPALPERRRGAKAPRHGWPLRGGDGAILQSIGLDDLLPLEPAEPHDLDEVLAGAPPAPTAPTTPEDALPVEPAAPFDLDALLDPDED